VTYRKEEAEGCRNLHNDKLCNLYSSPCIIGMINLKKAEMVGHVVHMREKRNAYSLILFGIRKNLPWQLKKAIIISVYKKGDKIDCSNY
jgi:hypothetical protein